MNGPDSPRPPAPTARRSRNHPMHERALVALWVVVDAMNAYVADVDEDRLPVPEHTCRGSGSSYDPDQSCRACTIENVYADIAGMVYTMDLYASCLSSEIFGFMEGYRRDLKEARSKDVEAVIRQLIAIEEAELAREEVESLPEPDAVRVA